MLNYRVKSRVLSRKQGESDLEFPSHIEIEVLLTPAASLGSPVPGRTSLREFEGGIQWDANTDRHTAVPARPLPALRAVHISSDGRWELEGDRLLVSSAFEDEGAFLDQLDTLVFFLPAMLNLEFEDPTQVLAVTVKCGDSVFRLQYQQSASFLAPAASAEQRSVRAERTLRRLASPTALEGARIQGALHYFHVASRLLAIAESPWEFMPEAVLNLNKVLEVLFCSERICQNSNQQARAELMRLGLEEAARERLISLMKLRNHMDVAHVDTWDYSPEVLEGVYWLLYEAECAMREMLGLLLDRVESGEFELKPDWDSTPPEEIRTLLEHLRTRYVRLT